MPRNAVSSVGYLWGRVRDAGLWDFCGARGRLRWLSQLGIQRLGALFQRRTYGQDLRASRAPDDGWQIPAPWCSGRSRGDLARHGVLGQGLARELIAPGPRTRTGYRRRARGRARAARPVKRGMRQNPDRRPAAVVSAPAAEPPHDRCRKVRPAACHSRARTSPRRLKMDQWGMSILCLYLCSITSLIAARSATGCGPEWRKSGGSLACAPRRRKKTSGAGAWGICGWRATPAATSSGARRSTSRRMTSTTAGAATSRSISRTLIPACGFQLSGSQLPDVPQIGTASGLNSWPGRFTPRLAFPVRAQGGQGDARQSGVDLGDGGPDGRSDLSFALAEQLVCFGGKFLGLAEVLGSGHRSSRCLRYMLGVGYYARILGHRRCIAAAEAQRPHWLCVDAVAVAMAGRRPSAARRGLIRVQHRDQERDVPFARCAASVLTAHRGAAEFRSVPARGEPAPGRGVSSCAEIMVLTSASSGHLGAGSVRGAGRQRAVPAPGPGTPSARRRGSPAPALVRRWRLGTARPQAHCALLCRLRSTDRALASRTAGTMMARRECYLPGQVQAPGGRVLGQESGLDPRSPHRPVA